MTSLYGYFKRRYWSAHPPVAVKSDNAVRIGILGAARIAPAALILPALSHPEAITYAVAARDLERAKEFAQQHGIEKVYGGPNAYQELLDDPLVDAIYNPLPNLLHYEWTMKALAAGKHVLLEKPTADRTSEARELFEYAEKKGLVLLEAFHYRFHPAVLRVKAILESGELGPIKSIDTHMHFPKGFVEDDDIRFIYNLGGGSMLDMGCYTLNTLRLLVGAEPTSVLSATPDKFPVPNGSEHLDLVDAGMKATFSFPKDVIGTMSCHHRVVPGLSRLYIPIRPDMGVKVICENGELEMYNHILSTKYHWIQVSVNTGKEGKERSTRVEKVYKPSEPGKNGEEWWTTYRYQLEAFIDKVKGREPQAWITPEDSVANMEWIEKVYEKSGLGLRPAATWKPSAL